MNADAETVYEAVTEGIRVEVQPEYIEDDSMPEDGEFVWHYTVSISNESERTVQLQSRYWKITDGGGQTQEVRGEGVVGETPVIPPGGRFTYTSGCPLGTPSGIMVGSYQMVGEDGEMFDVAIPAFSLDSPHFVRTLN